MNTEQRGKLWVEIRNMLDRAAHVGAKTDIGYEVMSAILDKLSRDLADNIEEMFFNNEPDDDDDGLEQCHECGGMGIVPDDGTNQGECDTCDGAGQVEATA